VPSRLAAPLSVHTHTHTHTNVHTRFFHIQTSNLKIKKDQTRYVDDNIVIKVTVVLTEIAWCTLQEE